jgi:hypothetical protein
VALALNVDLRGSLLDLAQVGFRELDTGRYVDRLHLKKA